ncbi:uncharacterized protein N7518_002769, partial [Penicillium psychrosexuale]|uniref:uncharacterized protein n=1 Tax=Penicillium psychrosexuale TaxID=1002107 RepID=UPI002544F252
TVVHEDDSGNKKYGGDALSELISRIKIELNIDEIWEGRLRYWSKSTKLVNHPKQGYLILLSDEINVIPGGLLEVGRYIRVDNEPVLGAGATGLFLVPN